MPGLCGGPNCRSEGKRKGKGEHANKWCCSKGACRRAMGIVESEADKKAREEAALAAAAAAAAAAAGAEGAPAPPAVPVPAAARAAPTRSRPSDAEAHYRAWCKMMASARGKMIMTAMRKAMDDDGHTDDWYADDDLEGWYEYFGIAYEYGHRPEAPPTLCSTLRDARRVWHWPRRGRL